MKNSSVLETIDVLWVNANPAFNNLHLPYLRELSKSYGVAVWEFHQSVDEGISLEGAIALLDEYLQARDGDRPIHLMGHGTGGLLALLYAYNYPEKVKSLTLLSVGAYPAVDWQAHFYAQFKLLPCSRDVLLQQTVYNLFGMQKKVTTHKLKSLLEKDLQTGLSLHSLYEPLRLTPKAIKVPLMVCCAQDDIVIDPTLQEDWQPWLKQNDQLWQYPRGRYFFHYFYPEAVTKAIAHFITQQEINQFCSVSA